MEWGQIEVPIDIRIAKTLTHTPLCNVTPVFLPVRVLFETSVRWGLHVNLHGKTTARLI